MALAKRRLQILICFYELNVLSQFFIVKCFRKPLIIIIIIIIITIIIIIIIIIIK